MRLIAYLLLSLNLVACATTARYVDLPEGGGPPATGRVVEGDRVQLVTTEGRQLEFRVEAVNEEGLAGDPGTVNWQDIQSLQVLESGDSRALWIVLGVVAAVGAAVLISAAVESAAASAILNCSGC